MSGLTIYSEIIFSRFTSVAITFLRMTNITPDKPLEKPLDPRYVKLYDKKNRYKHAALALRHHKWLNSRRRSARKIRHSQTRFMASGLR